MSYRLEHDHRRTLDHVPISILLPIAEADICITWTVVSKGSDEEKAFLGDVLLGMGLVDTAGLDSDDKLALLGSSGTPRLLTLRRPTLRFGILNGGVAGSGATHLAHARPLHLAVLNALNPIIWSTIGPWHPAVRVNPRTRLPSPQHQLASPVRILCAALTVVRGTPQLIANACSGTTAGMASGSRTNIRRSCQGSGRIRGVRIFSQNVNCSYAHTDYLLSVLDDSYDIVFLQEPPHRVIRQTVSTSNPEGGDVVGASKHPNWLYMVQPPANGNLSRVMAYVHNRLAKLRPSMQRDLIDHRDILILSLFLGDGVINLMNVYLDDSATAINLLHQEVDNLPAFYYVGSDFNCHSSVWDTAVAHHWQSAQHLVDMCLDLGVSWSRPANHGNTLILHNPELNSLVIDLVWAQPQPDAVNLPRLEHDHRGTLDHVPISILLPIVEADIHITRTVISKGSDEEKAFLGNISLGLGLINTTGLDSDNNIAS
ncbi:hypothetical protein NP233_g9402 [Leucocoprinus birnbaumii]|uniref:Endonuclease/exonuclease/phosphatase domain-containing protein n=1 Tax=Leucocoprinus birnbaumii TaxID=56174 RepID=A0AAD5VKF8_9AGAR|nr:hypothetical protein NP233_g9402 [Leucocoprinus birnbaumii]